MGGIGAADIFPRQANIFVSLARMAIRIFDLFPSRPITALNTGRVSLTNTGPYGRWVGGKNKTKTITVSQTGHKTKAERNIT